MFVVHVGRHRLFVLQFRSGLTLKYQIIYYHWWPSSCSYIWQWTTATVFAVERHRSPNPHPSNRWFYLLHPLNRLCHRLLLWINDWSAHGSRILYPKMDVPLAYSVELWQSDRVAIESTVEWSWLAALRWIDKETNIKHKQTCYTDKKGQLTFMVDIIFWLVDSINCLQFSVEYSSTCRFTGRPFSIRISMVSEPRSCWIWSVIVRICALSNTLQ